MNFIGRLFSDDGNINPWEDIKVEIHVKDTQKIYWFQIIDALPESWKGIILKDKGNAKNLVSLTTAFQENLKFVVLTNVLVKSYI